MENLTNEKKAKEICMNIVPPYIDFIHQNYKTAMEMAKWKDEQFKESKYYISIPKAEYEELLYIKKQFLTPKKDSDDKPTTKG